MYILSALDRSAASGVKTVAPGHTERPASLHGGFVTHPDADR